MKRRLFGLKGSKKAPKPGAPQPQVHNPEAGATATLELRRPAEEAHLSQLAVYENFSENGLYVKFGDEEAARLEREAVELALKDSRDAAGRKKPGAGPLQEAAGGLPHKPYTPDEALEVIRRSTSEARELPAPVQEIGTPKREGPLGSPRRELGTPKGPISRPASAHSMQSLASSGAESPHGSVGGAGRGREGAPLSRAGSAASGLAGPASNGKAKASLAAFFGRKAEQVAALGEEDAREREAALERERAREAEKRAAKERATGEPLQPPRAAREGAPLNAPSTPHSTDTDELARRLSQAVSPSQLTQAAATVAADRARPGAKQNGVELGYDEVLRDARKLRKELEGLSRKCALKAADQKKKVELLRKKRKVPEQEMVQALRHAEGAAIRAEAVLEGIEEMASLEAFIKGARPAKQQAAGLSREVLRQLLACLNHLGLGVSSAGAGTEAPGVPTQRLVARFRAFCSSHGELGPADAQGDEEAPPPQEEKQPSTPAKAPPPATPSKVPPPARASLDSLPAAPDTPPMKAAPPPQPSPEQPPAEPLPEPPRDARPFPMPTIAPLRSSSTSSTTLRNELPPIVPPLIHPQGVPRLPESPLREEGPGADAQPQSNGAAGTLETRRSRRIFPRARKEAGRGEGDVAAARAPATPKGFRRNPQVVSLFNELKRELGPEIMNASWVEPHESRAQRSAVYDPVSMTPDELYAAKAEARQHAAVIGEVAQDIHGARLPTTQALVEFTADANGRLATIMANEAAVLAQFPDWPKDKWDLMREAAEVISDMVEIARRERSWLLQRGTCEEELRRIEGFFDTARDRAEALAGNAEALQHRLRAMGSLPWDPEILTPVRQNCLHLTTLYMSRVLFEVAALERSNALQHEACLGLLAAGTRFAHKTHAFAGGFAPDASDLFDKVRRLTRYYLRVIDPTWLKAGGSQLVQLPAPSAPATTPAGAPLGTPTIGSTPPALLLPSTPVKSHAVTVVE